jgi:TLC domain
MHGLAELVRPLATSLQLSTLPLHIHHILTAYLLYEFTFRVLSPYGSQFFFPGTYGRFDRRGKINWDAHVVSMLQCLIINYMALNVMLYDPERKVADADWKERLWGYTSETGNVQGFAAGYFLWDTLVSIEHLNVLGVSSLVHGIAALGITMLGFRPFANYYGINFVLYELSTPFLNIHWFLDKAGLTGSVWQLINGILLIGSFAGARLFWGAYQSWRIYEDVWKAWQLQRESTFAIGCARFFKYTR